MTMFEILCTILNNEYKVGDTVSIDAVCNNKLFADEGYTYGVKERVIQYLGLLHKNRLKKVFTKFSKVTGQIEILSKIESFVVKDYRND
jgi:hypothetical protein